MTAKRSATFVWTSLLLVLFLAPCVAAAPENETLPADDAWTESLDFLTPGGQRGWGWRWRHEDKDKSLCKPVRGKTLLLDEVNKTTGKASIHFRYNSAEALKIRADIPQPTPRQIYNVLYLPDPPVDATGYDAIEFALRCVPEGAVTAVRVIVNQRLGSNQTISCTGRNTHFVGGEKWRRFGVYLKDLASIYERPSRRKLEKGEWTKCAQIIVDAKLSIEALKKTEYVDVWLDGLRFVKGKSDAAEKIAAAPKPAPPRPAGAFGELPTIEWEDLGVMVHGRTTLRGSPGLGFSTDKDGWSAYAGYRDHIVKRKPYVICEINLQTGKVKHFPAPPEEKTDAWAFKVFPDGRPYTMPGGGTKGARIARVDWKTGKFQVFGPCPDGWNYVWRWGGADNAIYIGGYRKGYAIRFDPETGEITNYGVQGPPEGLPVLGIAADDKYVYTSVGKNISCLIACDRKTREQRILRQVQYPRKWSLNSWDGQVFARLHPPTYKDGVPKWEEFLLRHGNLEPIPERPARKRPGSPREAFGVPRPELLRNSALCGGDGHATLWFKRPKEQEWQPIRYKVDDIPSYLYRLGMTPDGKIIGSSEDPYTIFTYDPKTGEKRILGPPPNMTHMYAFLAHPNGKTYMCGYSGAPLFEWDPAKPWNYQASTPEQPMRNWKDPELNPLQVARMYRQRRAFKILLAADGRLYIPCSAYVETFPGGGLGWYDPAKNEHGLIREGFEIWRGRDACTADGGRYVVVTTVPWPHSQPEDKTFELTDPYDLVSTQDGLKIRYQGTQGATGTRLTTEKELKALVGDRKKREVKHDTTNYVVTYDTKTKTVVGRLPIGVNPKSSDGVHGKVCEWKPGMVVVQATDAQGARYGLLDVRTQKLEFKLNLPAAYYRSKIIRLPDGRIAATHQNAVIFINPADWSWKAVGRLRPLVKGRPLEPRDWMVVGDDLYMYCDTQLARIRNIAAIDRR